MSRLSIPRLRSGDGERGRPASFTHGRPFMVSLGLAGVLAAVTLLYVGYNSPKSIPGRSYYTVNAQFKNADNLTASYQVRIGGELVGQVLRPRVENGLGVVDLQLKPEVGPLLSDTTLKVRPRSPVGVRFVELHPGTTGTPLKEGGTIPAANTSVTVQIDEALATFDADHRKKTQQLLNELGKGFLSRGEDINASIKSAPPTLGNLRSVAAAVNDVPTGVERFISGSDSAAAAADPVRDEIATGFAPEAKALRPFSDEDRALARDLEVAPAALRSVQTDLARVTPVLASLERVGRNAEPTLRVALPTLQATRGLLAESPAGLSALRTTLGNVRTAVPPTLSVLKTLKPVLPSLDKTLQASLPVLRELGPRDCDFRRFFGNWRDTLAYETSYSGVLRFNVEGTPETLQGYATKPPGVTQSPYPGPCAPDTQKLGAGR
ncbi:MAG: Mammalian cell entry related domain protein [Solirubrobacterales bacterium]|jgi:ABC-type transporter Mla subunit MlaD|nr:Mammalian cell entry related domain protein [Solirubrobacterales bacterium]